MPWWLWVIVVVLVVFGVLMLLVAIGEGDFGIFLLALVMGGLIPGFVIFAYRENAIDNKNDDKAAVQLKQQGIVAYGVDTNNNEVEVAASNCILQMGLHKVEGIYRVTVTRRINLGKGAFTDADVPVDRQYLAAVGKVPPCDSQTSS